MESFERKDGQELAQSAARIPMLFFTIAVGIKIFETRGKRHHARNCKKLAEESGSKSHTGEFAKLRGDLNPMKI